MPLIRNLHTLLLSSHSDCNHGIWRNLSTSEKKKFENSCQKLSTETSMYPVHPLSFSFNYFVHTSCKEWSWGVGKGVLYLWGVKKMCVWSYVTHAYKYIIKQTLMNWIANKNQQANNMHPSARGKRGKNGKMMQK